nr:hypothetical protein Iba_chr01aCG11590 [Ipomoea batatas]GMC70361.1 hypothetical protein Iba_scaffold33467CG0010 [Ipomoea batatas]
MVRLKIRAVRRVFKDMGGHHLSIHGRSSTVDGGWRRRQQQRTNELLSWQINLDLSPQSLRRTAADRWNLSPVISSSGGDHWRNYLYIFLSFIHLPLLGSCDHCKGQNYRWHDR